MPFTETHQPCPDCNSSDGLAFNDDGSSKCFVCDTFTPSRDNIRELGDVSQNTSKPSFSQTEHRLITAEYRTITDRLITGTTAKKYSALKQGEVTTFGYFNPDDPTKPIAAKVRNPDKRFSIVGDWKNAGLYGQHLFPEGGKYVTIVEGEYDALAAHQMTGSKFPVVSVRNGASSAAKDCRLFYDWLNSFETVVICFDADEPGQKAAKECADLFGSKAKIVKHVNGYKDACDYLSNNDGEAYTKAWWSAQPYTPEGIVGAGELRELIKKPLEKAKVQYPFSGLNKHLYGIRMAELVTLCAGSGLGKSTLLREIVSSIMAQSEDNLGLMFLEETPERTMRGLVGLEMNKPIHLPDCQYDDQDIDLVYDTMDYENRVFLWEHFGSNEIENVLGRMRYFVKVLGVRYIVLDHVSILVSDQSNGDERRALDMIMTKLRTFVQEMNICMFLVSHLKRPEGKQLEDGAVTSLGMLRGSASIAQLSDAVIGAERNSQSDDPIARNTTVLRVLKNRYTGKTGKACEVFYNEATGRLTQRDETEEKPL
jgi:twinkle protein